MKRRIQRKGRKSRRPMRRRRVMRKRITNTNQKHYATITETVQRDDLIANASYYQFFSLASFTRAQQIAPMYKFYRAKRVLWKYEPIYNVYGEGSTTDTVPYAIIRMNRSQEETGFTAAQLKQQGAIPKKFTSSINLTYVPNWCSPGLTAYQTDADGKVTNIVHQGLTKNFGWLQAPNGGGINGGLIPNLQTVSMQTGAYITPDTVTNQVVYNGHNVHMEQLIVGSETRVCRVTCTVVWEFKGARSIEEQLPPVTNNGV